MRFTALLTVQWQADKKSGLVSELSDLINRHIKNKQYGESIENFSVTVYLVNPPTGSEHLFKDFKPKYTEYKLLKSRLTGENFEIKKEYHYSIKITGKLFENFIKGSDKESKRIVAQQILQSFSYLDKLPEKVRDFEKDRLKADVAALFKELKLL